MKKVLNFLLLFLAVGLLTSCGQSKEAAAVDQLIAEIGEVNINSELKIADAENAYDALSQEDKEQLKRLDELEEMRNTYNTLKADNINDELERMKNEKAITQAEVDAITEEINALPDTVEKLIDKDLYDDAVEIKPDEKAGIVAVNSLMTFLENKSSLNLYEVCVKEGIGPDGVDLVSVSFSASNGIGANIDGSECIDVNRNDWSTQTFDYINLYLYLGGNESDIAGLKNSMTMAYIASDQEEVNLDVDRIMKNLDVVD